MAAGQHIAPILDKIPSTANRLAALDECCSLQLSCLEYVDDVVAPASSAEQCEEIKVACDSFTAQHGLRLKGGPTKSDALTVGHTRYPADGAFCEVELYTYLGVTLDRFLTFQPLLQSLLNEGRDVFSSFWGISYRYC